MNIQIGYGQIDPGAKADSRPSAEDIQPWVGLADLRFDNVTVANVATCEPNQAVLDGCQEHLPDEPDKLPWGLWSRSMSDDEGIFTEPPVLEVGFSFNHKSPGITLLFYPYSEDWASRVRVTWFDGAGGMLATGEYSLRGVVGEVDEKVTDFQKIRVEFLETNRPCRYVKLAGIDYGKGRTFPDDEIDGCQILEELDPTSNEVSINTLRFRLRTHRPEFSMVSGVGENMLMRNQALNVVADEQKFGAFFLKLPWKDVYGDGTVIDFDAVDILGAMDNYQFAGDVYEAVLVERLLRLIFDVCFPTRLVDFRLDAAFTGKTLSGYIPPCTCRAAVQQVAFALGAAADDSRRDYVWIYPPDTVVSTVLPEGELYRGASMQPTEYVSGIDLVAHQYMPGEDTAEAYRGELGTGGHTVQFSEPLHSLEATGASIGQSGANHAVLQVKTPGEVVVTGKRYVVNKPVFSRRKTVDAGEVENILVFDRCTMLSPLDAPGVLDGLFAYLGQRSQIEVPVRLGALECGYVVQVPTRAGLLTGLPIAGTVEQLDINLRAGSADMKVVGNVEGTGDGQNAR